MELPRILSIPLAEPSHTMKVEASLVQGTLVLKLALGFAEAMEQVSAMRRMLGPAMVGESTLRGPLTLMEGPTMEEPMDQARA